jgi:tetratricopeptide (TPR) repeat protein
MDLQNLERLKVAHSVSALTCCQFAEELEEKGRYEEARKALADFWVRVGELPNLTGLNEEAKAELLLRVGSLTRWLGGAGQFSNAQETAKNIVSQSLEIFTQLKLPRKIAQAYIALAAFYAREGAYPEARINLQFAFDSLGAEESNEKARAHILASWVEIQDTQYNTALEHLESAESYIYSSSDILLKARLFNNRGIIWQLTNQYSQSLKELAIASECFNAGGNVREQAYAENNLGLTSLLSGDTIRAHRHLSVAYKIFRKLKDLESMARVDETQARVFLSEKKVKEALKAAAQSVKALRTGGENAFLAESLITYGTALARDTQTEKARKVLNDASEIAAQYGARTTAGLALLVYLEELPSSELESEREVYWQIADFFKDTQDRKLVERFEACKSRFALTLMPAKKINKPSHWENFCLLEEVKKEVRNFEIKWIMAALEDVGGSVSAAARLLGMSHQALIKKIKNQYPELKNYRKKERPRSITQTSIEQNQPPSAKNNPSVAKDLLQVHINDNSFASVGIYQGDYVYVQPGPVREGDPVVIFKKSGEYIFGYYHVVGDEVFLKKPDSDYEDWRVKRKDIARVEGKIIGVHDETAPMQMRFI